MPSGLMVSPPLLMIIISGRPVKKLAYPLSSLTPDHGRLDRPTKYQGLIHAWSNNFRINLTFDGAMAIINGIQDRRERKKWIVSQIREMDQFNKDVDVMLSEYCAIMSHFQSLQEACIAAANKAYNINIVVIPFFPTTTLSS
ncbi:hypothetical protein FS837_001768 [Tulasnella sp. UAMH 9824]|nr:hypothetical protein FS837_001768 [Tulasnella sp. UAMH 9824]